MENANKQSNIENTNEKDYFREMSNWLAKIRFLKEEINLLEAKESPIIAFILKTCLIEWELKQLIFSLDLHLHFNNKSEYLTKKIMTPNDMDAEKWTLGKINKELKKYEGDFLNDLKINLEGLVDLRNEFIHGLFGPGSIDDLINKSYKGLIIANKVINDIEQVKAFLNNNRP